MAVDFSQHKQKIFQTNYGPEMSPRELLGAAASGLSQILDKFSGKKMWIIGPQPVPVNGKPGGLSVFATAHYPMANFGGSVGLTLGALPQDQAGVQFLAILEDSMGWETPVSESIADFGMLSLSQSLTGRFPQHGGWAMTKGVWRFHHKFSAPAGTPPDPPASGPQHSGYLPDDFYHNPMTARVWSCLFGGMAPNDITMLAGQSLGSSWVLEYWDENIDGVTMRGFNGHRLLAGNKPLYINAFAQMHGPGAMLMLAFGDTGYWSTVAMQDAMNQTVQALTAELSTRFPYCRFQLLPPPRQ